MPQKSVSRPRAWGTRFDSLPSSPPPSPIDATVDDTKHQHNPSIGKEDKMPHDASVFVGSLPPTIDHNELARLLSDHLSEHAEVKFVKVVRDSKGGVCAFVQCEHAEAAANLIQTLHSTPPRPFLGRILRYEPARAFRALLISYRTPMQFQIPANNTIVDTSTANYDAKIGQNVTLNLPFAMRIWRPRTSKYLSILYNGEAAEAEANTSKTYGLAESALHLQPVLFDEDTIRTITSFFGPLEVFGRYHRPAENAEAAPKEGEENYCRSLPFPHDAPRNAVMDDGCFEVKWSHRDDCVAALTTLRRVPHLTVTWAHQPPSSHASFDRNNHHPSLRFHPQNAAPYPLYAQDRASPQDISVLQAQLAEEKRLRAVPQPQPLEDAVGNTSGSPLEGREWKETDFPPLTDPKGEPESSLWNDIIDLDQEREEADGSMSLPIHSLRLSEEHFTVSPGVYSSEPENGGAYEDDEGQVLSMPPTPGLDMSPITPRTPANMFPPTPITTSADFRMMPSMKGHDGQDKLVYLDDLREDGGEKDLDRTTLFVGGLEMFGPSAWDEEKVHKFFERFDGLESVKVVRPATGRAAFAFVKFNNTESPARAVQEEHNRIYDGRAMRVQLRDCNPARSAWRGRGRGRYAQHMGGHISRHYGEPSGHENAYHPDAKDRSMPISDDSLVSPRASIHEEAHHRKRADDSGGAENLSAASRHTEPMSHVSETQGENYREWYEIEPEQSSPNYPSFSTPSMGPFQGPGMAYPMIPGTYYGQPSAPWVQPFPQHMPYPTSFMYPGYQVPHQQSTPTPTSFSSGGSDASAASSATTPAPPTSWPPMGMYGTYIPYPGFPTRPQIIDQSSALGPSTQPPVAPSGFIHNEQGSLIAVYPPEALDQYMTSSQPHLTGPTPHLPQISASAQQPAQAVNWHQFPQPPPYTIGGPRSSIPPLPVQPGTVPANAVGWYATHSVVPFGSNAHAPPAPIPMQAFSASPSYRGHPDGRRGGRARDHAHGFNTNSQRGRPLNGHNRNFHPRQNRPIVNVPGLVPMPREGAHSGTRLPQLAAGVPSSSDWTQWAAGSH